MSRYLTLGALLALLAGCNGRYEAGRTCCDPDAGDGGEACDAGGCSGQDGGGNGNGDCCYVQPTQRCVDACCHNGTCYGGCVCGPGYCGFCAGTAGPPCGSGNCNSNEICVSPCCGGIVAPDGGSLCTPNPPYCVPAPSACGLTGATCACLPNSPCGQAINCMLESPGQAVCVCG